MPNMNELERRLVLRYYPSGQFTFRTFFESAGDEQLYDTAMKLNAFQECPVHRVLKTRVMSF